MAPVTRRISGIAITRREHPTDAGTAADTVAVEGATALRTTDASNAAGERHRMQHLLQISPAAFAAP